MLQYPQDYTRVPLIYDYLKPLTIPVKVKYNKNKNNNNIATNKNGKGKNKDESDVDDDGNPLTVSAALRIFHKDEGTRTVYCPK